MTTPLRVLFAAPLHDYGQPERGLSFEYFNFYEPLRDMGHEVQFFDTAGVLQRCGRPGASARLMEAVSALSPDVFFVFMFQDELDPVVVSEISRSSDTTTLAWFADDHWRFDTYSSHWAQHFNWVATTDARAVEKYASLGQTNVVLTQWGAAHRRYRPSGRPLTYDVSFVGQKYGDRADAISRFRRSGLDVVVRGLGWGVPAPVDWAARTKLVRKLGGRSLKRHYEPRTKCTVDEMVALFEQSRVNLNLAAASQGARAQIKGRTFEVPAAGGLLLTENAESLADYFDVGKEIVTFETLDEAIDKCRYYLAHEDERLAIARAGHLRVLNEHTYDHRFASLFRCIGFTD